MSSALDIDVAGFLAREIQELAKELRAIRQLLERVLEPERDY